MILNQIHRKWKYKFKGHILEYYAYIKNDNVRIYLGSGKYTLFEFKNSSTIAPIFTLLTSSFKVIILLCREPSMYYL